MKGSFGEIIPLANGPAYLQTRTRAYANVNIQSECNRPSPDTAVVFLGTLLFDFDQDDMLSIPVDFKEL